MAGINDAAVRVRDTSWQMLCNQTRADVAVAATVSSLDPHDQLAARRRAAAAVRFASSAGHGAHRFDVVDLDRRRRCPPRPGHGGRRARRARRAGARSATACATTRAAWTSTAPRCGSPCAEYRPDSTTSVYRLEPGGVAGARIRRRRPHRCDCTVWSGRRPRRLVVGLAPLLPMDGRRPPAGSPGQPGVLRRSPGLPMARRRLSPVRRRRRGRAGIRARAGSAASGCSTSTSLSMEREVPFPIYSSHDRPGRRRTTRCGPRCATTS